jgi:hypothetical protein
MSETAVPTSVSQPSPVLPKGAAKVKREGAARLVHQALAVMASLKVTVVLFVLSIFLVFLGTLAQVDEGIWTVLSRYFRTGLAWIPLQTFVRFGQVFLYVPKDLEISPEWVFPYPGGWLLGGLLLVNLLAAHAVRFRITWKRSGILLIHSGLVVLMLSELYTGLFAVEGRMSIVEGSSSSFTEDYHNTELAVVSPANDASKEDVVVVPASLLKKGGLIQNEALPFDVEVVQYMVNSLKPRRALKGEKNPADSGDGREWLAEGRPEVSGTDPDQPVDMPAAYVKLKEKGTGKSLGTYLLSLWFSALLERPQKVTVGDRTYEVSLRFKRTYKDYTIQLLEFRHDVYMGTKMDRNFSSKVRLLPHNGEKGEEREVVISMNHPLRYGNETFYQASTLPNDEGTVLQVVENSGWLMPYFACGMVTLGMLVHFGIHLFGFVRRRFVL